LGQKQTFERQLGMSSPLLGWNQTSRGDRLKVR
jgi:hypothetical protein